MCLSIFDGCNHHGWLGIKNQLSGNYPASSYDLWISARPSTARIEWRDCVCSHFLPFRHVDFMHSVVLEGTRSWEFKSQELWTDNKCWTKCHVTRAAVEVSKMILTRTDAVSMAKGSLKYRNKRVYFWFLFISFIVWFLKAYFLVHLFVLHAIVHVWFLTFFSFLSPLVSSTLVVEQIQRSM